uniref:Uncharacterized protein n=1 Tax=Plectus sambesii TaxID=2011161 RepID=A0A914VQQ3_9BILA
MMRNSIRGFVLFLFCLLPAAYAQTTTVAGNDCAQASVLMMNGTSQLPVVCGLIGVPSGYCPCTHPYCMYSARLSQTVCCSVAPNSNLLTVNPCIIGK